MNPLEKKVILFGIFIFFCLTCTNCLLTMSTKIFEDKGMSDVGPLQFTVLFATVLGLTFFVNIFKINFVWQGALSTFPATLQYCLLYLAVNSEYNEAKIFVGIGAIFGGISNTFLVLLIGKYLSFLCEDERTNIKGYYFGIGLIFYGSSNLGASIMSIVGDGLFSPKIFMALLIGLSAFAAVFGIFVIENRPEFQTQIQFGETYSEVKKIVLYYAEMRNVISLIVIDGLSNGVLTSSMMHILPKSDNTALLETLGILAYGIGATAIIYLGARISDCVEYKTQAFGIIIVFSFVCIMSVLAQLTQSLAFAYTTFFLWGVFINLNEGFLTIMCCKVYNAEAQSFVVKRQTRALFEFSYSILMTATKNAIPLPFLMMGIILLCIPAFVGIRDWQHSKEEEDQSI